MREIKFRVWDKANCVMTLDFLCWLNIRKELIDDEAGQFRENNPKARYELTQYTGQKDSRGVDVYEGDVVKVYDCEYPEDAQIGKVAWFDCYVPAFDIYVPSARAATGFESLSDEYNAFTNSDLYIEVIGNIYQNPELLEVKS